MNKLFLLVFLLSVPFYASATESTPVLTTEKARDPRIFNPHSGHWLTSFGFEGMKYDVPFEFTGVKDKFSPREQELWGGRLGFGGEIYLGAGLNTTSKVEGYYMGTLFSRVLNGGDQDSDVKFAYTKRTGQIYGVDASQSIGFVFDMKTKNPILNEWAYLTVEPYIEAGLGVARAYNRLNYNYELGTNERYKHRVNDSLLNAKIGAGVNFTSTSGYFLYLKVTQNRYEVTDRKSDIHAQQSNSLPVVTSPKEKDAKIDPITVYAIGGGYKF